MIKKVLKVVLILVLIIAFVLIVGIVLTEYKVNKDVKNLFSKEYETKIYSEEQIINLPEPVQKYFQNVLQDGQEYIDYVRLEHGGGFRTTPEQAWSNIKGEEYFLGREPGFVWVGRVPFITGIDKFVNYEGNLQIKILSSIRVVNGKGEKVDQGEFLRWLGEAPLYPTALLPSDNLRWEEIDSNFAKVIYSIGEEEIEGVFEFNEDGEAVRFMAERYFGEDLEDWTGYYRNYIEVDGFKIPSEIEAQWNLDDGDFSYAKFDIEKVEFNEPFRY